MDEWLPIVDENGLVKGRALRSTCHNYSFLLHPVVHLHLFNSKGELCLQKRAAKKDIQPDKWDTAVGGHIGECETIEDALKRETFEELGIKDFIFEKAFSYTFRSTREFELINVFVACYDGKIQYDIQEIADVRFWTLDEIITAKGKNVFTPNFEQEFDRLMSFIKIEKPSIFPDTFYIHTI